jgi:hypothetical protein
MPAAYERYLHACLMRISLSSNHVRNQQDACAQAGVRWNRGPLFAAGAIDVRQGLQSAHYIDKRPALHPR